MTHLGFSRNQPLSFWGPLDSLASFGSPELEMLNARFWMRCRRSVLGGWFGWSYLLSLKNMSMVNRLLWNPQRKEPSENHWKLLSKNESLSTTFSLSLYDILWGPVCWVCRKSHRLQIQWFPAQKWGSFSHDRSSKTRVWSLLQGNLGKWNWEFRRRLGRWDPTRCMALDKISEFVLSVFFLGVGKVKRVLHGFWDGCRENRNI